ncbi:MAG: transporter permease subunit, partial [Deltaproteobacteria bacterium]|nr:transporter permease subunit [Deltaproteobacteria bacterium]
MNPKLRVGRAAAWGLVVVSVVITAHLSGVRLGPLFDAEGTRSAGALLRGFGEPELGGEFLWRIAKLSLESLLIGVLATTLAALIGVALAALCIRIPALEDAPERAPYRDALGGLVRSCVRGVLAIFRSIPDIVWAFLFVRMIGLGPGPAVLAIAISTGGIFGRLFAELAEAVEPESIRALRRIGVGRLGILVHGVLPQVWRQWISYAFYRLECSVRSASILGIVG